MEGIGQCESVRWMEKLDWLESRNGGKRRDEECQGQGQESLVLTNNIDSRNPLTESPQKEREGGKAVLYCRREAEAGGSREGQGQEGSEILP